MEGLPTAAAAREMLEDANKAPRQAHFQIIVDGIRSALIRGERHFEMRSFCLLESDLAPLVTAEYTVEYTAKTDDYPAAIIKIKW